MARAASDEFWRLFRDQNFRTFWKEKKKYIVEGVKQLPLWLVNVIMGTSILASLSFVTPILSIYFCMMDIRFVANYILR